MDEQDFQEAAASEELDAQQIDDLCLQWLANAANDQAPKVRAMMRSALDVIRKGLE